jgi:hypothetical protein
VFRINAQVTATALSLNGGAAELRELSVSVTAADYASVLDISGSTLMVTGGRFSAAARDGVVMLGDGTDAFFLDAELVLDASFVARAMEVRDRFPQVTNCRFIFNGSARRSDVFSGRIADRPRAILRPGAGTIGGNRFVGFTHILGNDYPLNRLAAFNQEFAPPGRANTAP